METSSTSVASTYGPAFTQLAFVILLGIVFLCAYRTVLHPLARVPGHPLQKVSGLPRIWQCYTGNRFLHEKEAHDKYGGTIRIAPNALSFSTLSALQTIHAKESNVFKGDEFYGLLDGGAEGGKSVQMTADNAAHAVRRKVLDKALPPREHTFQELNKLAIRFAATAEQSAGSNAEAWSNTIDMNLVGSWYSFDVISKMAFGDALDMLGSQEFRWVPRCLKETSIFLHWAGYAPGLRFWQWLLGSSLPAVLNFRTAVAAQRYGDFADAMLNRRITSLDSTKDVQSKADIFQHLLKSQLYSNFDLRADSSLLIAAGSDAIRLTVVGTIFYWTRNPLAFQKAAAEIRSSVASADLVSDSVLSSLKYLRASIDETLRLCPPKASSLPREVMKGGIVIDGIAVPEGMTVGTSTYTIHHDPTIFPDPYNFNPERWLMQPQDRRMQAAFCPFLKGPRACPGKTMAYFAIQLALFHLVYRNDVRLACDGPSGGVGGEASHRLRQRRDEYQIYDWITAYADGPIVELRKRA